MNRHLDREKLVEIIKYITPKVNLVNDEISLFSPLIGVNCIDMAYILLEIEKKFQIDLNMLIQKVKYFSIDEILTCSKGAANISLCI